ncbi:AraC family transcriptional regulator, partial [bacterium]|nr:AraC family transcriptional regulator [bacterium]
MSEIAVRDTEPMDVAYTAMSGPYARIPEALGRLYGWIAGRGLRPEGMPAAVYLTMPS